MRKLAIGAGLLAVAAVFWMARATSTDFLSTGNSKEGPQAAWISNQWSAKVAIDALTQSTEKIELTLADEKSLTARRSQAFRREDGALVWYGSLSESGQAAPASGTLDAAMNGLVLVISNGKAIGTLRWKGQVYRLLPASDGYVLQQVNSAKLPPDHAADDTALSPAGRPTRKPVAHEPGHATVRVLIAGTKNAGEAHEDLQALAQLAIEESNQTYLNSGIDMSLELAGFQQLDYEQSQSPDIDLRRLVATGDGYMDEVHQVRDELKADVVVLLLDTIDGMCGQASARPATAESAFVYVNMKCVGVWRFTTAHEIAHLQGASHEYVDDDDGPFLYGHGFIHEPENEHGWRTVMASMGEQGGTRVPFWSDPRRLMDGVPMGDERTADNRRLLEETKWTVAGFR